MTCLIFIPLYNQLPILSIDNMCVSVLVLLVLTFGIGQNVLINEFSATSVKTSLWRRLKQDTHTNVYVGGQANLTHIREPDLITKVCVCVFAHKFIYFP